MIDYNSKIILYPGAINQRGSETTNKKQDVITVGELIEFLKSTEANASGGLLSVPGNVGNGALESQLPYLVAMAAAGFDMSRIKVAEGSQMPDNVKLNSCRFSGAYMPGLIISSTAFSDLDGIDLSYATLTGAQITTATLAGSNLKSANLSGAVLTECIMNGSDLSLAILSGAALEGCDLIGCNLTGADLTGLMIGAGGSVNMTDCVLSGALAGGVTFDLAKINISGVSADGLFAAGASFLNAPAFEMSLRNCDFSECTFVGSGMDSSSLFKCNFSDSEFDGSSSVAGTSFESCDFSGATFTSISVQDANFLGCNFEGKGIEEIFSATNMDNLAVGDKVTWADGIVYEWTAGGWLAL